MKVLIGPRKTRIEIDGRDLWSLDYTLAQIIAPALKRFRKKPVGVPSSLCWDGEKEIPFAEASKKWKALLDEMIFSFDCIARDAVPYGPDGSKDAEAYDRVKRGLNLFAEWYMALWT